MLRLSIPLDINVMNIGSYRPKSYQFVREQVDLYVATNIVDTIHSAKRDEYFAMV